MTAKRRPAARFVLTEGQIRSLAFLGGFVMAIREGFLHGPERASLYALWGGMMTGAALWGKGQSFVRKRDDEDDDQ